MLDVLGYTQLELEVPPPPVYTHFLIFSLPRKCFHTPPPSVYTGDA